MSSYLLSAMSAVKDDSFNWLILASILSVQSLAFERSTRNKLKDWVFRLLIKRAEKRARKGKFVSKEDRSIMWLLVGVGLIGIAVGLLVKSGGLTIGGFCLAIMGIGFLLAGKRLH